MLLKRVVLSLVSVKLKVRDESVYRVTPTTADTTKRIIRFCVALNHSWMKKVSAEEETHAVLPSDGTLADVFGSPRQLLKHRKRNHRMNLLNEELY